MASLQFATIARAEEGGTGHYFPGSMASFVDGVPAEPTFILRLNVATYDGSADATRQFSIAGSVVADVEAESLVLGLTLLWAPDWDLGENWSYAMSATIPWVDLTVSADVGDPGSNLSIHRTDAESGLGDMVLIPLMFNYRVDSDLNFNLRLALYAPTGDYEVGRLANPGKNFWTVEPTIAVIYLGQKNGIEASLFFGVDFNAENEDTNYQSGTQAHLDGTLAQHFPLWGGLAGAGVSGYWYRQVEGDSGSGATLGDFKARANGIGPVVSWTARKGNTDVIAELKWLHEFDNKNRLEGDVVWFKLVGKF